ncbi:MAG: RNA-binding domain-containing protein [Elusimicrobiota bacterium]
MNNESLTSIVKKGEGLNVEFKKCSTDLSNSVYETVCAFLNRNGGELLLGIDDDGKITGVDKDNTDKIKKDFAASVNNPQILNPTFYLNLEKIPVDDKEILYVYVPESSLVHKCKGRIYDRNEDGDFDITDNSSLVTSLYVRKQATYSENKIYPYLTEKEFKIDLIERARKLAVNQSPDHPWGNLGNIDLLKSAQLYMKDYNTGKEGFTLASVLLFGKDEVILSVLPHHRTDAVVRVNNIDRYDDRDDIRTNLVESYDRLMEFGKKHLPDKFHLEEEQRISLRDHILREVSGNMLIHREYVNPFPAKFVIEKDRIYTENSNRPHGYGLINPDNFSPYPKNPNIAKVFKAIGRADELGSGIRNLFKYCKIYGGGNPRLMEEDVFRTSIPVKIQIEKDIASREKTRERVSTGERLVEGLAERLVEGLAESQRKIYELMLKNPYISKKKLSKIVGISTTAIDKNIKKLKEKKLIKRVGPPKGGQWKIINNKD